MEVKSFKNEHGSSQGGCDQTQIGTFLVHARWIFAQQTEKGHVEALISAVFVWNDG